MPTTFLVPKNNASGSLKVAISAAALTLTLQTGEGANFPTTYPFHISIDDERLEVSDNTSDVLTFTRAAEGSSAAVHTINTAVRLLITAQAISDLNSAVNNRSRSSTCVVAASNAPANMKDAADYLCDGTADQVQIQAAIDV